MTSFLEYGALVESENDGKTEVIAEKPVPLPLGSHISHVICTWSEPESSRFKAED